MVVVDQSRYTFWQCKRIVMYDRQGKKKFVSYKFEKKIYNTLIVTSYCTLQDTRIHP